MLFRDAVNLLRDKTVETFIRMEELEGKFAVMSIGDNKPLELNAFTPVLEGRKLDILTDLRFREAAADLLADYAALLVAVADGSEPASVDIAAEKMETNLAVFRNAALPDGVGQAETTGIFDAISADLPLVRSETNLEKNLTSLMTDAQIDVQSLASFIIRDYGDFKTLVERMIQGIIKAANKRRPLYEDYVDPALTAYDARIAALVKESKEMQIALDNVAAGFAQVPEAHFAIRNILGRQLTGLPALHELLRMAKEAGQRYRVLESDVIRLP